MDMQSRSRCRQGCCAALFAAETLRRLHCPQAVEQAINACKMRWALCSADDPDPSATANSISSATLCDCSWCCRSAAWCGTSAWQLVEKQIQPGPEER